MPMTFPPQVGTFPGGMQPTPPWAPSPSGGNFKSRIRALAQKGKAEKDRWGNPLARLREAGADEGEYADELRGNVRTDRERYSQQLDQGQGYFERSMNAAVSAALPQFREELQGVRESAIARGISTGDLGTSYEGDLASAFQRNVTNSAASGAADVYRTQTQGYGDMYGSSANQASDQRDRYLDVNAANLDYNNMRRAQKKKSKFGSVLGGAIGGFIAGGPYGAAAGAVKGYGG